MEKEIISEMSRLLEKTGMENVIPSTTGKQQTVFRDNVDQF